MQVNAKLEEKEKALQNVSDTKKIMFTKCPPLEIIFMRNILYF